MGNKDVSTKYKVLQILRASSVSVSGETIARQAGVSRVSVWKAVQALQEAGYVISSSRSGYSLSCDFADSLFPWEFGADEQLFMHFSKVESTMDEARSIVQAEERSGAFSLPAGISARIITADSQTNGRGHSEHTWTTTKGSLACTVITDSRISAAFEPRIMMAAQIALAEVLSKASGRKFFVRWPNDIWTEDGKVCGILDEFSAAGGITKWINIGIGVNINSRPELPDSDCVFTGEKPVSRKELLSSFYKEFSKTRNLALEESGVLCSRWNSLCPDVNKKVRVMQNSENARNLIFEEINSAGWAVFRSPENGGQKVFPPGNVSFIKKKAK